MLELDQKDQTGEQPTKGLRSSSLSQLWPSWPSMPHYSRSYYAFGHVRLTLSVLDLFDSTKGDAPMSLATF
jgi:hypothetical protein